MSIFFSAGSMAGAFSGLLAFAIQKMEGVAGKQTKSKTFYCKLTSLQASVVGDGFSSWKAFSLSLLDLPFTG